MQWIKTLIMFLALFWGGDALCAQSQSPAFAKHTPATHSPVVIANHSSSQEIAYTNQDKKFLINNYAPDTNHHNKQQKPKYRCGQKRWKNTIQRYHDISQYNQSIPRGHSLLNYPPSHKFLGLTGQQSMNFPDILTISIHKLSNLIEPLK